MKAIDSAGLRFDVARARLANFNLKSKWSMACWILFLAGLLTQLAAPRLKIEHNQFVIPGSLLNANHPISPSQIVARERWMQLISAVLAAAGALGLGVYHRSIFLPSHGKVYGPLPIEKRVSGDRRAAHI